MNRAAAITPPAIAVFGIPNCDTVKRARLWLNEAGQGHSFHDFKKLGASSELLTAAADQMGWQALVNRQGTTWRKLDAATQASVVDQASALACLQRHTSLIKRPLVRWADGSFTVGFSPELFSKGKYRP